MQGGLARATKDGWPDRRMGVLGNQAILARQLGVSPSTICHDVKKVLAELRPCPTCGAGVGPPGPGASDGEDSPDLVDEILARHRENVRQGKLGWAGRGPLSRPEAGSKAGPGPQDGGPAPVGGEGE